MIVRQVPRFTVELAVLFNGDRGGSGIVQDLSVNGCLIVSDTPVEPGDYLCLWLYIPHDSSPVVIEGAEVRWSAEERFGVCFLTLQRDEQIRLFEYINTIATT
ncbi:MAG TPA: PilZ domain-containing protein [Nitrospiraceae bacterium]|nr:PilZ domain-containing protein [Nitrospiraceae bacterium]